MYEYRRSTRVVDTLTCNSLLKPVMMIQKLFIEFRDYPSNKLWA
jgi:hypothetical protein